MDFKVTLYFSEEDSAVIKYQAKDIDSLTNLIESMIKHGEGYTVKERNHSVVYNFSAVRKFHVSAW